MQKHMDTRMPHSEHVAIVDDDANMRMALTRLLRTHGIDARPYPSGVAFLAALPEAKPYCIIVDVHMPGMSGLDLQRKLLKLGVHIPTIVISGLSDEDVAATARRLGAIAFFSKPMAGEALVAAIAAAQKPG